MPELDFHFSLAVQVMGGAGLLAEPISMPGISFFEADERRVVRGLEARFRHALESRPLGTLYRCQEDEAPVCGEVTLEVAPAGRHPAWIDPVPLRFHVVRWRAGNGLCQAYVPALGIAVLAETAEALDDRLPGHIRLALGRTRASTSLRALAALERCVELRVSPLRLRVSLKTPKQAAVEAGSREKVKRAVLPEVAVDLTKVKLVPAFEAQKVVLQLAEALGGSPPRSVLLVGASGVGKTAAWHELVRRRAELQFGETPFWATSGSRLVAGMTGFGMWQARCQQVVSEAAKTRAIVHLGGLSELIQVGRSAHNTEGIASFLRPALGRGELLGVVECTPEQLPSIERQDPHLLDVFQRVTVEEPDFAHSRSILTQVARHAQPHGPGLDERALDTLDRLHRRYATYSAYPGRPVRFLRNLLADRTSANPVGASEVTALFSRETGLPGFMLDDAIPLDLEAAGAWFAARVLGQVEAATLVVDLLATIKARLARPRKPLASFLFIGPTGVGKTEMAKALAEFLFGSRDRLVRYDLSEFADPLAVRRLAGGQDGAEGLLTARVREQPFSVVLLDEFEKGHPLLFDLLLQVLGEGRLTDEAGRLADFTNTVVVMTSNLGAQTFREAQPGFVARAGSVRHARQHFEEAVERFLRPELFRRIDAVVPFAPLDEPTARAIVRRELGLVRQRDGLQRRSIRLDVTEAAERYLAARGFDVLLGARPLKRAIERELLVPLANALNCHPLSQTLEAAVGLEGGRLRVDVRSGSVAALVSAPGSFGPDWVSLAEAAIELHRALCRLRGRGTETELENRVAHGVSIERQVQRGRVPSGQEKAELDRLPRVQQTLERLGELHREAAALESETLVDYFAIRSVISPQQRVGAPGQDAAGRAPSHGEASRVVHETDQPIVLLQQRLETLRRTLDKLLCSILELEHDRPDALVLAVYSDAAPWMFALGAGYLDACRASGHRVRLERVLAGPRGRKEASMFRRQPVPDPAAFLASPVEGVLGLILTIEGPLAWPRWEEERGRHAFKDKHSNAEAVNPPRRAAAADYAIPAAAARRGGLRVSGRCRAYDVLGGVIDDCQLGRRLSRVDDLGRVIASCVEDRFERRVRLPVSA